MKISRLGVVVAVTALCVPGPLGASSPQPSQQQTPSLGDLARRLREQRKDQPKSKQVWTNDNIPTTPGAISIVGVPPTPEPVAKTEKEDKDIPKDAKHDQKLKGIAETEGALLTAHKTLDDLRKDFDLFERQLNLDSQQFYGTPDFSSDREGQAKIDAETALLEVKRQEVAAAKQKVDDLEAALAELKGETSGEKTEAPLAAQPPSQF